MPASTFFAGGSLNGETVDIECSPEGLITSISPASDQRQQSAHVVDLAGHVIVPSFAEPHAHLDKAFLADRVTNPEGDLMGAIRGLSAIRDTLTHDDIVDRALRALRLMSQNGVTSVRTHADTTLDAGLSSVLALLEAKRLCADFIDLQVAMLLDWPLSGPGSIDRLALARDAIDAGVDVVGGCPHLDENPRAAVETLLSLAIESGLPLDLHADENLRPDSRDLEHLADLMIAQNVSHHVVASHCVALSARPEPDIRRIAEKVATAGIIVVALPHTNLFLQGRNTPTLTPRAITPVRILRECGVIVAAGADNLQDPFNPVGRADPLETAALMVMASQQNVESALEMVTANAHTLVSGEHGGVAVDSKANFVAIPATNVREAIAMGPPDRTVVYGGVVIDQHRRNRK
jgi:cytosine deaminase